MFKRINKISNLKLFLASLLILVLAGGYYHYRTGSKSSPIPAQNITTTKSGAYVNLSPATAAERQDSESKKSTGSTSSAQRTAADGKKEVSIVITSSDPSAIKAFVQGVIEDGGTCAATISNGSTTKTGTSSSISNVSYTVCPPIDLGSIGKGSWTLSYTYSSNQYSGAAKKAVEL
jgi:hypothetical protein